MFESQTLSYEAVVSTPCHMQKFNIQLKKNTSVLTYFRTHNTNATGICTEMVIKLQNHTM